jgi:hypothetical protein
MINRLPPPDSFTILDYVRPPWRYGKILRIIGQCIPNPIYATNPVAYVDDSYTDAWIVIREPVKIRILPSGRRTKRVTI